MRVLVVYGSQYGSTKGIAERIAKRLVAGGHQAAAVQAKGLRDIAGYEAFVIGSAVYMGSWLKEPADFVRRNAVVLAGKPVWLFSSGPLGSETTDAQGKDLLEAAVPKDIAGFGLSIHERDHRVFFGALDHKKLGLVHRALFALPAARKLLIEGDFRDWSLVDAWAADIGTMLTRERGRQEAATA